MSHTKLLPGLSLVMNPKLDRIHRIGEEAKNKIIIENTADFGEIEEQFVEALEWIKARRREER